MSQYQPSVKLVLDGMFGDVDAIGADTAGNDLIVPAGRSTGNSLPSAVRLQTPGYNSSSGSTPNGLIDAFIVNHVGNLSSGVNLSMFELTLKQNSMSGGFISAVYLCTDGTDFQVAMNEYRWMATDKAGTHSAVTIANAPSNKVTAGTITPGAINVVTAVAGKLTFQFSCTTTLTPTLFTIAICIRNFGYQAIVLV